MGQFTSFSEFLKMDGYAFYVWTSYGLSIAVLVALVVYSRWSRKKVVQGIKRQQQLAQHRQQNKHSGMRL